MFKFKIVYCTFLPTKSVFTIDHPCPKSEHDVAVILIGFHKGGSVGPTVIQIGEI